MYTVKREIISLKVSNGTINMIHQITISLKIITSPSKKLYSKVVRNRRLTVIHAVSAAQTPISSGLVPVSCPVNTGWGPVGLLRVLLP